MVIPLRLGDCNTCKKHSDMKAKAWMVSWCHAVIHCFWKEAHFFSLFFLPRVSRPTGAVQSRWGFSEARGEAVVPALPGPPHHAHWHLGQRLTAPHWLYCHRAQGRINSHLSSSEWSRSDSHPHCVHHKWSRGSKMQKSVHFTRALSAHDTPSVQQRICHEFMQRLQIVLAHLLE